LSIEDWSSRRGRTKAAAEIVNLKSEIINPVLGPMLGDKIRIRFSKSGTLRLLSHHDLMRTFERMLRRANLPFKSTAGFHPGPRIVFALSLPLGIEGREEVVEIEFIRPQDSVEVLENLRVHAPVGLEFLRATVVAMNATALPRRTVYRMPVPLDRAATVADRGRELMAEPKVWVERIRPSLKRLNIRPYLRGLTVQPGAGGRELELDLWVTQTGSARADELLELLDIADLPENGAVIARTTLEIRDEVETPDPADGPPDGPADTESLDPAAVEALTQNAAVHSAGAGWSVSPPGPVVE
jgi:radical SAM-linked protein